MVPAVIADREPRFIFAPIQTGGHQTGGDVKSKLTELPMKRFAGPTGSERIVRPIVKPRSGTGANDDGDLGGQDRCQGGMFSAGRTL